MKTVESHRHTVSELAELIAGSTDAPNAARITRRLRHLTAIGALFPLRPDIHTGAGRHREYGADAVVKAKILIALGDMGITVGSLRKMAWAIERMWLPMPPFSETEMQRRWNEALAGEQIFLVFQFGIENDEVDIVLSALSKPDELADQFAEAVGIGIVLLDLRRVLRNEA